MRTGHADNREIRTRKIMFRVKTEPRVHLIIAPLSNQDKQKQTCVDFKFPQEKNTVPEIQSFPNSIPSAYLLEKPMFSGFITGEKRG